MSDEDDDYMASNPLPPPPPRQKSAGDSTSKGGQARENLSNQDFRRMVLETPRRGAGDKQKL